MKTILIDAANTFTVDNNGTYEINEELQQLVEVYQNRKIIVTNANAKQQTEFGLTNLPYPLFTMAHQPNKDSPAYFSALLRQYSLEPADVVYFEHSQAAVDSAKSLGIDTYFYDHTAKNMDALKEFLDKALAE